MLQQGVLLILARHSHAAWITVGNTAAHGRTTVGGHNKRAANSRPPSNAYNTRSRFDERLWQKAAASTSPRVYFMLMRPPADRARASERRFKRLRSVTCWAALLLAARAHLGVGPSRVEVRVFALSLQLLRFLLLLVVKRHHLLFCVARHKAEESEQQRARDPPSASSHPRWARGSVLQRLVSAAWPRSAAQTRR